MRGPPVFLPSVYYVCSVVHLREWTWNRRNSLAGKGDQGDCGT